METGKCSPYSQQQSDQQRNYITIKEGREDLGGGKLIVSLKGRENVAIHSFYLLCLPMGLALTLSIDLHDNGILSGLIT